jgi:hypothetical protein
MNVPTLQVLENKRTGSFLLINFGINPQFGFNQASGHLIPVDRETMRDRGIALIQSNLDQFTTRPYEPRLAHEDEKRFTRKNFDREHKHLGVRQPDGKKLILSPMRRERGGYIGQPEEEIQVSLPCTPEIFFEKLSKALELCD